ncbi:MAG: alpha/beta hydrolase [Rikenellaceae bacterium]
MKSLCLFITLIFCSFVSHAQEGKWSGELNAAGLKIKLIFDITKDGDRYLSSLSVPVQNVENLKMDITTFENNELLIVSDAIGLNYSAKFEDNKFVGPYSQNGIKLDLTLEQSDDDGNRIVPYQTPAPPYDYDIELVEFTNRIEKNTLSATLTTPKEAENTMAVVLVSGSGAQNRDSQIGEHRPFHVIADYLTRNGIAVLRYDDRLIGSSIGGDVNATTEMLAYDAEAAVEYLRSRKEFSKVGVIGHSEGGAIAFMLAGNNSYKTPDFIVSMAGIGVTGAEILLDQHVDLLTKLGLQQEAIEITMKGVYDMYNLVVKSKKVDDKLRKSLKEVLEKMLPEGADREVAEAQNQAAIESITAPWVYYFIKYNPLKSIVATKIPVLAINGTLDRQVNTTKNLSAIESALTKGGNSNFEIAYLEGLNHMFQTTETGEISEYTELEETFSESALEVILDWLKRQ